MTWSPPVPPPGKCPIQYTVNYTYINCDTSESESRNKTEDGGSRASTLIDGIQPYWNYTISVSAQTEKGSGNSMSNPQETRTLIDGEWMHILEDIGM